MTVAQLTENLLPGDAISRNALALQKALQAAGFNAPLHTPHDALRTPARQTAPALLPERLGPEDVLLYHYSTGSALNELFFSLPCRKAIVYHNVTPAEFFEPWDARAADRAHLGREQLALGAGCTEFALADSAYSARELMELGYKNVSVLPLLTEPISATPDRALLSTLQDGSVNLLFVGRKVPNKRIEDLIAFTAFCARGLDRRVRLVLPGDDSMGSYCTALRALIAETGAPVLCLGRVSEQELAAAYAAADVYISFSAHEGYGAPLVEAMAAGVPVLAYAAAAVPETMGTAGVLFDAPDYAALAAAVDLLRRGGAARETVLESQRRRCAEIQQAQTGQVLLQALARQNILSPAAAGGETE